MTGEQAIATLRGEIAQLAVAATETCLRDRRTIKRKYLDSLDRLALQLAEPAREALRVIERELADAAADSDKAKQG